MFVKNLDVLMADTSPFMVVLRTMKAVMKNWQRQAMSLARVGRMSGLDGSKVLKPESKFNQ